MTDFAQYPSLQDRAVLITGGGSGIGAALVEHFARQNSRVVFCDIDADSSRALVDRLAEAGLAAPVFLPCDLRDIDALRAMVRAAEAAVGPIRVLVNNAGHDQRHSIDEVTPEYWDDRLAVNLKHQFFAVQAVRPGMREAGGGSVINFGSISWRAGMGGMPAYTTAKAAIEGLTRSLARDLGVEGIRVNCVLPGAVRTERQVKLWYTPEYVERIMASQCLKGVVEPDDIARMAAFLASDDARMCTSQMYVVDGGWI
ncbi:MAG: SDR family oxidoreductase [Inquilinus limosus]|uniref:SDR family oxidoreductase n=1 Tax=Inquilinus limosus TaxID=171674 RepID=A0A952FG02_9PROT|nr:SDR family oxidoreductase [Inquilinus limosus]